jgi:hypothetical protein
VIVGTKLDLVQEGEKERCVSRKDGQTFARNESARYVMCGELRSGKIAFVLEEKK